jgi:hypothetical protein
MNDNMNEKTKQFKGMTTQINEKVRKWLTRCMITDIASLALSNRWPIALKASVRATQLDDMTCP